TRFSRDWSSDVCSSDLRIYPLRVDMEEEEVIRRAVKLINDKIKEFQENYAVRDKQDLLSMCVLHYATAMLKAERKSSADEAGIRSEERRVGKEGGSTRS